MVQIEFKHKPCSFQAVIYGGVQLPKDVKSMHQNVLLHTYIGHLWKGRNTY